MSTPTTDPAQYLGEPDVVSTFSDITGSFYTRKAALDAVRRALAAQQQAMSLALEVLRDNNRWHIDYDEYGGYDDSELQSRNLAAIHALEQMLATPPSQQEPGK